MEGRFCLEYGTHVWPPAANGLRDMIHGSPGVTLTKRGSRERLLACLLGLWALYKMLLCNRFKQERGRVYKILERRAATHHLRVNLQ